MNGQQIVQYRRVTAYRAARGYPAHGFFCFKIFKMGLYRDLMKQPMTIFSAESYDLANRTGNRRIAAFVPRSVGRPGSIASQPARLAGSACLTQLPVFDLRTLHPHRPAQLSEYDRQLD